MGDLQTDTELEPLGDGRYGGSVSRDWEIWGPMGGVIASFALRAAGAESPFPRPASLACHYLGVAAFGPIEVSVRTLRAARTARSDRVVVTQAGRSVLEALVWSVGEVSGLTHYEVEPPAVPGPEGLPGMDELRPGAEPRFRFWNNFESRPLDNFDGVPNEPLTPEWRSWLRFRPRSRFEDLWVDACRYVILVDVVSWPAGHRPHASRQHGYIAPSLDLYVAFHQPVASDDWLLAQGVAPIAGEGLLGWHGRVWAPSRRLVASGGGQAIFRHLPPD